jgi:copper chaperone CopZ
MIELEIRGMTCPHCVRAVSEALANVPGVTRVVAVELETGRALIEGMADPGALIAAVRTAGYEAETA